MTGTDASALRTRVADWLSLAVAASGAVVLVVGWWLGVDGVTTILPGLVSMKANAALGFVIAGAATAPSVRRRAPQLADGLGALLAVLGGATVLQYATGLDLGIDELLAADPALVGTASPGRMGLNSALAFLLLGVAAPLVDAGRTWGARVLGQAVAGAVLLLAGLALFGYVLGVASAVGLGSATQMALHTSVLFILQAVAVLAVSADVGLLTPLTNTRAAGRTARLVVTALMLGLISAVALNEGLVRAGVVDDAQLETALVAVLSMLASVAVVLLVLQSLARSERRAAAATIELETVRSAFRDLHLRVTADDQVVALHGPAADFDLRSSAAGQDLAAVLPDEAAQLVRRAAARTRDTRQRQSVTYDLGDGTATHEVRLAPLAGGDVGIAIRDVSDLARAQRELADLAASLEEQVEQRTEELARTNRELERFAYIASHDLKEPLRMVTGFVSRIADRYGDQLDERGRQYVHFAVDGAERMQALIDGLLAYSRAGRLDPARIVPVDLADLADDVVGTMRDRAAEVDGEIRVRLDPAPTVGDPVLLRQVVQNLVANGLRFSREGVPPVVEVATGLDDGVAVLTVTDNGVGVPAENREEVFEVFRRFSTDPRHRGTGIGLSIVQQVVASHGGTVEVGDAPGGGACFTVRMADEDG